MASPVNTSPVNAEPAEPATEVRWLAPEEQAVWRSFLDVSRLITEHMNRQLSEESGMSLPEYEILVALSEAPDRRLRMSELADRVISSRSRITHTVGRMEERALVHREACLDDGRGVLCVLTDAGFAVLEAAAPGYLTGDQWDALGEDWLEQALAYTAVPCKGARGPLTRIRPRPVSRPRPQADLGLRARL